MMEAMQPSFLQTEGGMEEIKELSLTKSNCQVSSECNAISLALLPFCKFGLSELKVSLKPLYLAYK